jgi:hypothetical protein
MNLLIYGCGAVSWLLVKKKHTSFVVLMLN